MVHVSYIAFLFGLGAVILLVAWLPLGLRKLPLSVPIICLALGAALQAAGVLHIPFRALERSEVAEHLTEAVLLIALMGAGLRLDRPFDARAWHSTWRLLLVTMPITILGVMAAGLWAGFGLSSALLLAAALSPTDPVLAGDVQTGPPGTGDRNEVRFALTSEAGLNDGLAFPFVLLAVALAKSGTVAWGWWLAVDLAGKLLVAVLVGWAGGKAMGWVMFRLPRLKLSETGDGLVAVGVTLLAYATAQALHAYGFVTVFAAAVTIRASAPDDAFHKAMAGFSEQVERVLLMLVVIVFGASLAAGLLDALTWAGAAVAMALIFVLRPAAGTLAFLRSKIPRRERMLMGFFGIRGIGTIYYLLFALRDAAFADRDRLWAVAAFAILVSVIVHGVTSTPLMRLSGRRRGKARPYPLAGDDGVEG